MTSFYALIPAAGSGSRMASRLPKQYLQIAGKTVLRHVIDTFAATPAIAGTFVAVSGDDAMIDAVAALPTGAAAVAVEPAALRIVRCGGDSRQATVRNALQAMRGLVEDDDWVMVHDAARPGLTVGLIERLIVALQADPVGGLLAMPVVDTLKRCDVDGRSIGTVARDNLWQAQTPQMFRYGLLCRAIAHAEQSGMQVTDEASAVEALGLAPRLVLGDACNFKLTLPADVAVAERHLILNSAFIA